MIAENPQELSEKPLRTSHGRMGSFSCGWAVFTRFIQDRGQEILENRQSETRLYLQHQALKHGSEPKLAPNF